MNTVGLNIVFLKQNTNDNELIKYSKLLKTPYYCMQIGTARRKYKKNHSASVVENHVDDENYILMAVADINDNENIAAESLVRELNKWFRGIRVETLEETMLSLNMLICYLRGLNQKFLCRSKDVLDASFGFIIKRKASTIVINVGCSRCYTIKNNEINEVPLNYELINHKNKPCFKVSINIIENDYDDLILTTFDFLNIENIDDISLENLMVLSLDLQESKISNHSRTIALYNKCH